MPGNTRAAIASGTIGLCSLALAGVMTLRYLAPAAAPWAAIAATGSVGTSDVPPMPGIGQAIDRAAMPGSGLAAPAAASSSETGVAARRPPYANRFSNVTAPERHCLARAVYFEARGEPIAGQIAIAQVVLNRVAAGRWPPTICGVVYQGVERGSKCQFSFACTDTPKRELAGEAWERAEWIADEVLSGGAWLGELLQADHFHRVDLRPVWRLGLQYVRVIGRHVFYAPRGVLVDRTWISAEDRAVAGAGYPAAASHAATSHVVTSHVVTGSVPHRSRGDAAQLGSARPAIATAPVADAPATAALMPGSDARPERMGPPAPRPARSSAVADRVRAAAPSTGWVDQAFRN